MQENQVLRQLLKSLSGFIGDGAGGLLPKLGWDLTDFNNFVNRSETDTAWESYQRHRREEAANGANASAGPSNTNKRPSEEESTSNRAKRPRSNGGEQEPERDGYPLLVPVNSAVPPLPANGLYPPSQSARSHESNLFNDLMRGPSGSPMFVPPTSPVNNQYASSQAAPSAYSSSYIPPINVNVDSALPMPLVNPPVGMQTGRVASGSQSASKPPPPNPNDDDDPKRHEAYKLIQ